MSDTSKTSTTLTITIPLINDDGDDERTGTITLENPSYNQINEKCATLNASLHAAGNSTFFQPTGWNNQPQGGMGVFKVDPNKQCEFKITNTTTTYLDIDVD